MYNKELGGAAVRVHRSCHGDHAPDMGDVIFDTVVFELSFDTLLGAAGSVAQRVTALDHKAADDAVESQAVIETVFCQIHKIGDGDGSSICIQLQSDGAVVGNLDLCVVETA